MAEIVYILCCVTSLLCAVVLVRAYIRSKVRFLMWSSVGFLGFAGNNAILFTDLVLYPDLDLAVWRLLPAFLGLFVMTFGVIWDTR